MARDNDDVYEDDLNDLAAELEVSASAIDTSAVDVGSTTINATAKPGDEELPTVMNYFWQPIVGMIFFGVCLFFLNLTSQMQPLWSGAVTALAASTFYVFSSPKSRANTWWNILGSYVFAIVFGEIFYIINHYVYIAINSASPVPFTHVFELFAFVGILIASWIMLALRLLHAPAIGLAIIMIYKVDNYLLLLVMCLAIIVLVILKVIFSPWLKDL